MQYLGDYVAGETVYFMWNSADSNGASITRSTNGTISVYKDANTTQTTTGVTDTEDFDALTGVHHVAIATSDAFYTTATDFMVVLSAATIDTRTVNAVLAHFSIENRSGLRPTTAGRTLDVSAGGEAGVDWANVGSPTTVVGLSGTTIKTATDVETDTAEIGAAGAGLTALATQASVNTIDDFLDTEIAAIKAKTDQLTFTTVNQVDATTMSTAAGAITAASIAANAIDADALAADALAEINAEVVDALATDTYAESSAVVPATASLAAAITWIKTLLRNKITQTATTQTLRNDADSGTIATSTISDDGTTFTRGEWT